MIAVEGTIFAFGFLKKYDISHLSIKCRVLERCRAFDRLACVDALFLLAPKEGGWGGGKQHGPLLRFEYSKA
jgi:hypothetical protein